MVAVVFVALAFGLGPGLGHVQRDLAGEHRVAGVERRRHFLVNAFVGPGFDAVKGPYPFGLPGLVELLVDEVQRGTQGVGGNAVVGARFFADLEYVANQKEVGILEESLESGGAQPLALHCLCDDGPNLGSGGHVGPRRLKLVGAQRPIESAVRDGDARVAGKFELGLAHPAAGFALAESVRFAVDDHHDGFGALHQTVEVVGGNRFAVLRQR